MTLSRWKVLACTLTVGVGGLAVFATPPTGDKKEPSKEPAPLPSLTTKPPAPPAADDTPAPVKPVISNEYSIDLPVVPAKAEEVKSKPSSEPVFEPVTTPTPPMDLVPVKGEENKDAAKPNGLQLPKVPTPDLDVPIRAGIGSGRVVPASGTEPPTDKAPPTVVAPPTGP